MQEIKIEKTDFTLWEIEFEISNNYDLDNFSFEEAKKDFSFLINCRLWNGISAKAVTRIESFEKGFENSIKLYFPMLLKVLFLLCL